MTDRTFDGLDVFKELPASVRRSVALQCCWQEYQPDQPIAERGATDDALLILAEGRARVLASVPGGGKKIVRYVQRGEIFGEIAPVDGGPRWATVVACDHCLVASVPSDLLWNLMDARPKIMKLLLKRLAKTVRDISISTAILLAQSI